MADSIIQMTDVGFTVAWRESATSEREPPLAWMLSSGLETVDSIGRVVIRIGYIDHETLIGEGPVDGAGGSVGTDDYGPGRQYLRRGTSGLKLRSVGWPGMDTVDNRCSENRSCSSGCWCK